jgi:periplasmic divalent cation tolerance protein
MSTDLLVVLCSVPEIETARRVAGQLLDEKVAACVSIIPGIESHYSWQGQRQVSGEVLLLIKTMAGTYGELEVLLQKIHPYECPEIVALSADRVSQSYLDWVKSGSC